MKELEKAIEKLENNKIEKAQNRAKLLNQKISKLKRSVETKRKIEKGGVFEAFEREITGNQEITDKDLVYAFLYYVLSDSRYREKLKQLTEINLQQQELDAEESEQPDNKNGKVGSKETKKSDEEMRNNFSESKN
ncbi:hypothetical protein HMPREF0379_1486 [[Eubacterium] yurii subsp. margaretiae ATCC 43715]|nr:hypothetical protein HMPREF0379_1486 [[Eubacterium] yurii subsp. margaretiae ATCC 43715]